MKAQKLRRTFESAEPAARMSATNLAKANPEAKANLQRQIREFGLPPELAQDIIDHHTLLNYNKGAMVVLQGSPADVLFYVITGLVKVYCPRPDGTRILIELAGPGDFVGYADYVDSRGSPGPNLRSRSIDQEFHGSVYSRAHFENPVHARTRGPAASHGTAEYCLVVNGSMVRHVPWDVFQGTA